MSSSLEKRRIHFKEIQSFSTDYSPTTITQYESARTGMRIVVVDQEGPTVHGSFVLATEIHDDSGAPHTLEHLCFLGSKNYRYKGVLDKIANRAYADTNAFTSTDHTEYILDSAGWKGFAQILPVYLEHLIAPTLTDAGCYTEVHHVDGTGNDAGVVYSEMQGCENSPDLLMFLKSKRVLYPEDVGFRYETFGVMESLRNLTADRIRKYHKDVYRPQNLCVVIIGEVDHENLLDIMEDFESTILEDIPDSTVPFQRPWIDSKQAPCLESSSTEYIYFPEDDESSGEIQISFFGPSSTDSLSCRALFVLLTYLAGSSASVLERILVEQEQVASSVPYEVELRPTSVIQFSLTSVATEQLKTVQARFFEIIEETAAAPLDMQYMQDCIKRERRQVQFYAEASAQHFKDPIINDFLFGERDGSTLRAQLQDLKHHDELETWGDLEWKHRLSSWISDAYSVTVIGIPSADLAAKLKSEEEARIKARKESLGTAGLEDLQSRLAAAKAQNGIPVPGELLERFVIPDTDSIHFIGTTTARSGAAREMGVLYNEAQEIVDQDRDLPFFIHFEHIQSQFAFITLVLSTEVVPLPLRPLLPIYMDNFFSAPMSRNGRVVRFDQVIKELEKDTIEYGMDSGQEIGNSEAVIIKVQVEVGKYNAAIRWIKDLMGFSIFDPERITATTARLLADIPESKRDGSNMVTAVELMTGTAPASISRARNTLVKALYLKRVKSLLKTDPQSILKQLAEINTHLCQPSNIRILVTADIKQLQRPVQSWEQLLKGKEVDSPLKPLDTRLSRLSEAGRNPGNTAYIIPMPSIDSSFALIISKGPSSLEDPVLPALMVATSYLSAVEGPFWTAVRGTGLSYGTTIARHVDSGQIALDIYSSPDAFKAFVACKEVVEDLVSGKTLIDRFTFEGAISSIVLGFANGEATRASAAQSSFVRQVIRGVPKDWPSIVLEKVRKVTVEEVKDVLRAIVLPIFHGETANLFVTCAPSMEEGLVKGFGELGFKPEVRPLAFFQDDYGLQAGDGSDEPEDEDEDEDEIEDEESEENGDMETEEEDAG
ncbi:hypothetical protein P7C71_g191, partial [Lecanoromycetidae sp. Uapishka_2]